VHAGDDGRLERLQRQMLERPGAVHHHRAASDGLAERARITQVAGDGDDSVGGAQPLWRAAAGYQDLCVGEAQQVGDQVAAVEATAAHHGDSLAAPKCRRRGRRSLPAVCLQP
jgi:hypothetical protein